MFICWVGIPYVPFEVFLTISHLAFFEEDLGNKKLYMVIMSILAT